MTDRSEFPYTVLMLKPQPIATSYGKEIVLYHVEEDSADEAIVEAQCQAFEAHETEDQDPADWHVLAVFEGHHDNMAPPPQPVRLLALSPEDRDFLVGMLGQIDVQTPSAARWAMVARISRKIARVASTEDVTLTIRLDGSDYRVLDNLLWETKKVKDDQGTSENADRVRSSLLIAFPDEPVDDTGWDNRVPLGTTFNVTSVVSPCGRPNSSAPSYSGLTVL